MPQRAGGPALVQGAGADAERRDGADPGDRDASRHASARADQVDGVADGLEVLHVVALDLDAVLVLDDLRQLDEVERVHVERLEGRLAVDLARLGAERDERRGDALLDFLACCRG